MSGAKICRRRTSKAISDTTTIATMTERQKALETLNLPADAQHEQVEAAYKVLALDLRQRINEAPSHLKSKFQDRFNDTTTAYHFLIKETAPDHWLPSSGKVEVRSDNGIATESPTQGKGFDYQPDTSAAAAKNASVFEKYGQWFFASTILATALAIFFGIKWSDASKELAEAEPKVKIAEDYEKFAKNQKFKIRNVASTPYRIEGYQVFFIKNDSIVSRMTKLKEPYILESGKSFEPETVSDGTKTVYNGEALFYSISVSNMNNTMYDVYSGVCEEDGVNLDPKF
jgi:hypothetical protein